ncbi:hypothetical protein PR202_gb12767 [Eleusine coracana subsp. coracana]|uniref:Protein kinase domain-containing protein n=1 Tax=Eleusine coracana subsp. coracana TaxID=191504 RepID=A0AAV5ERB8_ELECO|nr:hypothetical protein PR202_gb12767 [Eleusine coracana subsp. coracana]
MMDGLQTTSAIAQVAGVDALSLITMIMRAANTAIQNKKTCLELAKQVEQIRELLRSLEEQPGTSIMRRAETSAPLLDLHETLRRACVLVESCQQGGCVRQFCAGGARAARLRDVQGKIDSFLRLFPIISYLDSTRLLVHGQLHGNDVTLKKHSVISSAQQLPWSMSTYELFRNEVKILPKLQHKNIVKLVGFCAERRERVLVYEYMQNGSLEDLIFVRMTAGPTVDWPTRFRIIEGIAQEYMKNGTFSVKTDVYSFGVILLEVISGKRWTKSLQDTYYRDLLTWAFKGTAWCGKKLKLRLKDFMHPSIHRVSFCGRTMPRCLSFPARRSILLQQKEIIRCVRVALLCIQENPQRRPDMPEAARMLRPRKAKVSLPRRPGYATETSMYVGDRSTTP